MRRYPKREGEAMYGKGIAKGLWVTFNHFINTYIDDIRYAGRKYFRQDNFEQRQGLDAFGAFTVQYPDEKLAVPERFRFIPFLVVEDYDSPERPGHDWCTSCGICAKVCPPQCIWIVRGNDPVSGRPIPEPEAFYIDIDICMNCGYCAEFCPFDAIKMDHDYELASYDRTSNHIYDKERLSKEFKYWKSIAPTTAIEEMEARGGWEHTDVLKERKKAEAAAARRPASSPGVTGQEAASSEQAAIQASNEQTTDRAEVSGQQAPEAAAAVEDAEAAAKAERLRKREEALARKRAREAQEKNE
jgi:NADH-quinone oxidoreductase subunit I